MSNPVSAPFPEALQDRIRAGFAPRGTFPNLPCPGSLQPRRIRPLPIIALLGAALCAFTAWSDTNTPPSIAAAGQPTDQSVSVGGDAVFRVSVAGTPPLVMQWRHEQTRLDGATNSLLALHDVQPDAGGGYDLVASNAYGAVTSRVANLRVDTTFVQIQQGPVVEDLEPSVSASWSDFDRDGDPDLFVANAGRSRDSLYLNNGDGTFAKLSDLPFLTLEQDSFGGIWFDADRDGQTDLLVFHPSAPNRLYRQEAPTSFRYLENALPKTGYRHYASVAADYNLDGWPDVFLPVWNDTQDLLLLNTMEATFRLQSPQEAGTILSESANTYDAAWCDYDLDGDPDLFVCYEDRPSGLFRNDLEAGFVRETGNPLADTSSSVSAAWADYDNDGDFDLLVLRQDSLSPSTTNSLFRNLGGERFEDVGEMVGVAESLNSVGGAWGDYDNDGDLDLFLVNYERPNTLYRNDGQGTLSPVDVGSPLAEGGRDYSPSWVDYNNDGLLDLFFVSGNGQPEQNRLFQNNLATAGNTNHWLAVNVNPPSRLLSKKLILGTQVRILATIHGSETWQLRQIAANGPFSGGHELTAHFGLGDATSVTRCIIEWPSGQVTETDNLGVDQVFGIREPDLIRAFRGSPANTVELASASLGDTLGLTAPEADTYQWQRNGVDLVGEIQATLLLEHCTPDLAGRYSVEISKDGHVEVYVIDVTIDSQVEVMPQGVAPIETPSSSNMPGWSDYDGDGDVDLFVSNRGGPPSWDDGPVAQFFYRNLGDGTFQRLTAADVGSLATDTFRSGMASWGDYDNDGDPDLLAGAANSPSRLYENLGDGRFRLIEDPIGVNQRSTWGLAWADANQDSWLDVAFSLRSAHLLLGSASGTFSDDPYFQPQTSSGEFPSWSHANTDLQVDLFLGDTQQSELYWNLKPHVWVLQPNLEAGWWGTWSDYDNDGDFDLYAQTGLFQNDGTGSFTRADTGLPEALGAVWGDYDNDSDLDVYLTGIRTGMADNALYVNDGQGRFMAKRVGSLSDVPGTQAGCAWADYDNDGTLDLYMCTVGGELNHFYHGRPNGNHWLIVKLRGTTSNRSALGAIISVESVADRRTTLQTRQISGSPWDDLRAHFGLGSSETVRTLTIRWPSGNVQEIADIAADQILEFVEPRAPVLQGTWTDAETFSLIIGAEPGQRCRIEVSENLSSWTAVAVLIGPGQIEELETSLRGRFYRAIVLE